MWPVDRGCLLLLGDPTSGISRGLCKPYFYCGLFHLPDLNTDFSVYFTGLILTAGCSVCLIWTQWFLLLISAFEMGLMAGVNRQQGMLTPCRHLISPLVYPEVRVCPIRKFEFPTGLVRLMTVRYLCYFTRTLSIFIKIKIDLSEGPH